MWKTTIQFSSGNEIHTVDGQFFPPIKSHMIIDGRVYEVKKFVSVPKALLIIIEVNLIQ
ncbi:MAG: hypothetical protein HGA35_06695 [Erysipelotrichaceae bacterium]|nr:hypothetical protein [Erysipelotrichaceae bacterium]